MHLSVRNGAYIALFCLSLLCNCHRVDERFNAVNREDSRESCVRWGVYFGRDASEFCVGRTTKNSLRLGKHHYHHMWPASFVNNIYRENDRRITVSLPMTRCRKYPACDRAFGEPPLYSCTNSYKRVLEAHLEQAVAKITESYEARTTTFRWAKHRLLLELVSLVSVLTCLWCPVLQDRCREC